MTARRLSDIEEDESNLTIIKDLTNGFVELMHAGLGLPLQEVATIAVEESMRRLSDVFTAAIALSRLFAKDKAANRLEFPKLKVRAFNKTLRDEHLTTQGNLVGMNGEDEE